LQPDGLRIDPAPLLWPEELPDRVRAAHDTPRILAPQVLTAPPGTTYGGNGLFARDGALVHPTGLQPAWIARMVRSMGTDIPAVRTWTQGFPDAARPTRHIGPSALVPLHPHGNYGHVLLESLPRALWLDRTTDPTLPILVSSTLPPFVARMLHAALPHRPLLRFDPRAESLTADTLIGASDLITDDGLAPEARDLFTALANRAEAAEAPRHDRLFLSRRAIGGGHGIRNLDAVESLMDRLGFTRISPETLTFGQQVAALRAARIVVGEYGSAMHNTVFCRPGTTVVCLNWINGYQSQIATLMGLTQGYILPADGQPRDTARLWSGDRQMRFALADLRARLRPLL
jgi:capsular polysaccharide biosynthesis protein